MLRPHLHHYEPESFDRPRFGYAQVANTAGVTSTTGGTFADNLVALAGDNLAVANYDTGGARWTEAWGIDSLHVAEIEAYYTRPSSTHDQTHGVRFSIASAAYNAVGHVGEVNLFGGPTTLNVFKSDTLTLSATTTASDCILFTWITEYDDLPGAAGNFATPAQVMALQQSTLALRCSAVASGTAGIYGTQRAIQADDTRLHADKYYAILGCTVQTAVHAVTLIGPDWAGQRIAIPAGNIQTMSSSWFVDQSLKWNKPLIPVFNSNNANGQTLVQVVDSATSTSPQIDFLMYELSGNPNPGVSGA